MDYRFIHSLKIQGIAATLGSKEKANEVNSFTLFRTHIPMITRTYLTEQIVTWTISRITQHLYTKSHAWTMSRGDGRCWRITDFCGRKHVYVYYIKADKKHISNEPYCTYPKYIFEVSELTFLEHIRNTHAILN